MHVPVADPTRVRVIDSNLSTVTAEADKVLWIDDPNPSIEHIELQATRDVTSPIGRTGTANLGYSRKVPVHTTIVVLRPAADGPELSGTLEQCDRQGDVYNWFRYNVVRIWHQPVQEVLSAGLPVLPLAPVADVQPDQVGGVLAAISERFIKETSPDQAATLWAATKVMMGLRYSNEQVDQIIERVSTMTLGIRGIEESSVYQDIFAKGEAKGEARGKASGRAEGLREALSRVARRKLGEPDEVVRRKVESIEEIDQLDSLLDRIPDALSWDDLLNPPAQAGLSDRALFSLAKFDPSPPPASPRRLVSSPVVDHGSHGSARMERINANGARALRRLRAVRFARACCRGGRMTLGETGEVVR